MKLAALLVEIRRRSRTLPAPDVDPLQAIYHRCHGAPETGEQDPMRIARAIAEGRGDFDDADIWALSQESLGLLDALIERDCLSDRAAVQSSALSSAFRELYPARIRDGPHRLPPISDPQTRRSS